jgi:hypothetical protein
MPELDFLFLAGDVFDQLIEFPSDDSGQILAWVGRLLRFCSDSKIKLRVLEGTPAHDWRQSSIFTSMKTVWLPSVDVRYIDQLSIECDEDTGLTMLYVPDEWSESAACTYAAVEALLLQHQLTQVDIAVMHGQFYYQLPTAAHGPVCHSETAYLNIVRYYISVGHIHTFNVFDRIIPQGSFDRIAHGEEEAKGAVWFELDPVTGGRFLFMENTLAQSYLTLSLRQSSLESAVSQISVCVATLRKGSHLRIKAKKDHPIFTSFFSVQQQFPDVVLSKYYTDGKPITTRVLDTALQNTLHTAPMTLTKENLTNILLQRIEKEATDQTLNLSLYRQCVEACL